MARTKKQPVIEKIVEKKEEVEEEEVEEEEEVKEEVEEEEEEDDEEEEVKEVEKKELTKKQKKEELETELDNEFAKIAKFSKVYKEFRENMENACIAIKKATATTKKINKMYHEDIRKARHMKRKNPNRKPTGFAKEKEFPDNMLDFIGVPRGTKMAMPQYTKRIWQVLKDKKLVTKKDSKNNGDGRIIRVNNELQKVFNLTDDMVKTMNETKDSKDVNGLNFMTLQSYISKALKA